MISSSIHEDRYGVVQKDLPRIISSLFVLQKVSLSQKKTKPIIWDPHKKWQFSFDSRLWISTKGSRFRRRRTVWSSLGICSLSRSFAWHSSRPFTELSWLTATIWILWPCQVSIWKRSTISKLFKKANVNNNKLKSVRNMFHISVSKTYHGCIFFQFSKCFDLYLDIRDCLMLKFFGTVFTEWYTERRQNE